MFKLMRRQSEFTFEKPPDYVIPVRLGAMKKRNDTKQED